MKTELMGLIEGLPSEAYHDSEGISFTGFKEFLKYPAKFKQYLIDEPSETASQKIGKLAHMAILEPELFQASCVHVEGPMNRNPYKAQKDAAEAEGKIPVGHEDWLRIQGMRDAVLAHPEARLLFAGQGQSEISCYWRDPEFGVLRKCRPDRLLRSKRIIADFKTCSDASREEVERSIIRLKYHLQSAWYLDGLTQATGEPFKHFLHVFVEVDPPHGVALYALDDETLERSRMEIAIGLKRYARCLETNEWPGLPTGIQTMSLPYYAFSDGME